MAARSKVAKTLSANALQGFCALCAETPNLTLQTMCDLAKERGIDISISAAARFRDGPFSTYLKKISAARDLARNVAELNSAESAGTLADAAASVLMQDVFETMLSGTDDDGKIDYDTLSKIISRLRIGDHRLRELTAKLKEYERREEDYKRERAERDAAKTATIGELNSTPGITPEARENLIKKLKLM